MKLNTDNEVAYLGRGIVYASKGDSDQSIADLTQAIKIDPKDDRPYFDRGRCYREKGDKTKAIADFRKVIELTEDPDVCADAERFLRELEM